MLLSINYPALPLTPSLMNRWSLTKIQNRRDTSSEQVVDHDHLEKNKTSSLIHPQSIYPSLPHHHLASQSTQTPPSPIHPPEDSPTAPLTPGKLPQPEEISGPTNSGTTRLRAGPLTLSRLRTLSSPSYHSRYSGGKVKVSRNRTEPNREHLFSLSTVC